jgi:hypothetical protein
MQVYWHNNNGYSLFIWKSPLKVGAPFHVCGAHGYVSTCVFQCSPIDGEVPYIPITFHPIDPMVLEGKRLLVGVGLGGTHDQIMWLCMNIWKDTQRGQSQEQALTTFFPYLRNINPNWHWHVCDILEPIIGKEGINNGDIQKMFGNWQVRSETTHFPTIYN